MPLEEGSFTSCEVANVAVEPLRLLHLLVHHAPVLVHLPATCVLHKHTCTHICTWLCCLELGGEGLVAGSGTLVVLVCDVLVGSKTTKFLLHRK